MPTLRSMTLDAQTFYDLEIFAGQRGDTGVFDLIDVTRTSLGRQALIARLRHPPTASEDVAAVQQALGFLRDHPVPYPLDNTQMSAIDKYLRSSIEVSVWEGPASRLATISSVLRHDGLRTELSRGVAAASKFVIRFREYCGQTLANDPGDLLTRMLKSAAAAGDEVLALGGGAGGRGQLWSIVKRDAVIRGRCRDRMRRLVEAAAEVDALQSMAKFGAERGYCLPELAADRGVFAADGLAHPLVENAVGNHVSLDGSANVIYLTGPNMAGKTTFLKAIGVAQFLAQSGMLAPAKKLEFSPVDTLFAALNTSDDLSGGVSYYLAEVRRMKEAAKCLAAGQSALMLFDEAFKGTNVRDATEATRLVVASCAGIRGSRFVFSSHLAELSEVLAAKGVAQRSFAGEIKNGEPCYDYRIREGASNQRMGLYLLEQEGVLALLGDAVGGNT